MLKKRAKFFSAAVIIILSLSIFAATRSTHEFPPNSAGHEVVVAIDSGESGISIANKLEALGVVQRASKFIDLANHDSRALAISAGSHRIHTHLTSNKALVELLDQSRLGELDVVKEGSTLSDVLKILAKDSNLKIDGKMPNPYLKNSRNSLEGQLFPATYTFATGTARSVALQSMVKKFESEAKKLGLDRGYGKYSAYQVLTVASMVQIEGDPGDYAKVASVIYNRLKIGMPLQLNSTVQYAANLRGKIFLSTKATQIASPYNTYRNIGLPPTPISNPGSAAIDAALNPESNDFLYFITVKPGDTRLTKNYCEFGAWAIEYNKNLAAGKFK